MSTTDKPLMLCQPVENNNGNSIPLQVAGALRGMNSNCTNRAASRKSRVYYMYQFLVSTYSSIFSPSTSDENNDKDDLCQNYNETTVSTPSVSSSNSSSKKDYPQPGDDVIILDVAGGKGDLSWFINNLHPASSSSPSSYPSYSQPTTKTAHAICSSKKDKDDDNNNNKQCQTRSRPRQGVHSVVMDPRPTDHRRLVKSAHFLETTHPELVQQRNVPGLTTFQPLAALLPRLIKCRDYYNVNHNRSHSNNDNDEQRAEVTNTKSSIPLSNLGTWKEAGSLRIYVDTELVQNVQKCTARAIPPLTSESRQHSTFKDYQKTQRRYDPLAFEEWKAYWKRACNRADPSTQSLAQTTAASALDTITQAKLIIGFHPDQATEAIVDLAMYLQIPYCIVPCCVFPSEFPHRTVVVPMSKPSVAQEFIEGEEKEPSPKHEEKEGEDENLSNKVKVRDYALFLEYLRCKHSKVRIGKLGFPYTQTAKNVVLYTLPQDMLKQEIEMD